MHTEILTDNYDETFDFHAWLELDGKVIDWDIKSSNLKKKLYNVCLYRLMAEDFEPVYIEWTENKKKLQEHINKVSMPFKWNVSPTQLKSLWNQCKDKHTFCLQRCLILQNKNPKAVIKYGSMGLKDKKGNVWFEWGNGSKNPYDEVKHIIAK
jgi:hypothetical protein